MNYPHIESATSPEDLQHECNNHKKLRTRNKGTSLAYAYQCQFCGKFCGGEVSKKSIPKQPPHNDEKLNDIYRNKYQELTSAKSAHLEKPLLDSNQKILELENVIEKYCSENDTNALNLLQAYLIRQRDQHINREYVSNWSNEYELHDWFLSNFSEWFEIHHEVKGTGFVNREKENIRIDFIIKAKKELIDHGFTDRFIGIEVKYLNPVSGKNFHGKSSRGIFQALSYWYSGARWSIPNEGEIELATVLLFSNLSFDDEANFIFETFDSHYQKTWSSYLSIANHANVGELLVRLKNNKLDFWSMEYSSTKYYAMYRSRGLVKGNPNVINKKRIGSTKR